MSLKALIFDVDGTISNTEKHGHLVAFNKSFQFSELDWNWSSDLYSELLEVTGGKLRIKHYVENYLDHFDVDDLDKFALELHQLKTNFYVELMNEGKIPLRTELSAYSQKQERTEFSLQSQPPLLSLMLKRLLPIP